MALQRTLKKHKLESEKLEKFNKNALEFAEKENDANLLDNEEIANNNQEKYLFII